MAQFNFENNLDSYLNRLSPDETREAIDETLKNAGDYAFRHIKGKMSSVIGEGTAVPSRSGGTLQRSFGKTEPGVMSRGYGSRIILGFHEPRKKTKPKTNFKRLRSGKSKSRGTVNAAIANIIEYGRYSASQPAKPFDFRNGFESLGTRIFSIFERNLSDFLDRGEI